MKGKLLALTFLGLVCATTASSQLVSPVGGPLLSKTVPGVNAPGPSSVTLNVALDRAFLLKGTVSSSDPASAASSVTAVSTTSSATFFSVVDATTHAYRIVLPADTYNLNVTFDHTLGSLSTSFTYTDSTSPAPFSISADTIRNVSIPLAITSAVSGNVSNLSMLFPNRALTFDSTTIPGFLDVSASSTLDSMGNYSVQLPNGGSFNVQLSQKMTSTLTFSTSTLDSSLPSFAVGNSPNFMAPSVPTANLTGNVSVTGTSMFAPGSFLLGSDVTGGAKPPTVSSGSQPLLSPNNYGFTLATNRTYTLDPSFPVQLLPPPPPPDTAAAVYSPPDPSPMQLTADTIRNVSYPALPGSATGVTISGKVTITNSITPVAHANVGASGMSITGAPNTSFFASTSANAFGNYSLVVPAGMNYTLSFSGSFNTSGDFDGDGKADLAVWRPSSGTWYIINSGAPTTFSATQWGINGDIPARGDYDGDGQTDMGVWRPSTGTWYIIPSSAPTTFTATQWGASGDIPVPGDYDGDGKTDMAVWRPSTGTWYIIPSSMPGTFMAVQWGMNGDIPVPGDYDGDGKTDMAVWRPSTGTWYVIPSSAPTTFVATQWGVTGDIPVPGDYDGDGKTDKAVWRPSTGTWYIIPSSAPTTFTATQWGVNGDVPVPADYDRDRKTDKAVWRPSAGSWYIIPSSAPATFTATQWGVSNDVPVQKSIGQ